MLGGTLALAVGSVRRQGWGLVFVAGLAAALPDLDGVSLAFGAEAYARVHRTWGHNFLIAGCSGALVGGVGYLVCQSAQARRATLRLWPSSFPSISEAPAQTFCRLHLFQWMIVGVVAGLSHLPVDALYSGHPDMRSWPVQVFWPFSSEGWVLPVVAWGSVVTSLIFITEMFAIYRWPQRAQAIAFLTLLILSAYLVACWLNGGIEPRR